MLAREDKNVDPSGRFAKLDQLLTCHTNVISYKAYDRETGMEVTWFEVNVIDFTKEQRQQLLNTAERFLNLRCNQILSLLHYWENFVNNIFYFVTETINTSSISNVVIDFGPKLKPKLIAKWFIQILSGLQYLHEQDPPISHLKITAKEVFIKTQSRQIKLQPPILDPFAFNIGDNYLKIRNNTPPEYLFNRYNTESDIWMVGCLMLTSATGVEPYSDLKTPSLFINALKNEIPPSEIDLVDDPLLKDLLRKCFLPLSNRPTARELLDHPFFHQQFPDANMKSPSDPAFEVLL